MPEWQNQSIKFNSQGLDLVHTLDEIPEHAYSFFSNAATVFEGSLTARPGLKRLGSTIVGGLSIHSIRSLGSTRIIGAGTRLNYGALTFSQIPVANPTNKTGWTGNGSVISMVPWRPTLSPTAWMYLTDGSIMRKLRADGLIYGIGIDAPTVAASAILNGAGNLTGDYDWRYTYYNSSEGVESNPSPEMAPLAMTNNKADVTMTNSADAQVDSLRLYRRGGTLADWFRVATVPQSGGATTVYTDNIDDDVVGLSSLLSLENDKPFTTVDAAGNTVLAQAVKVLFGPFLGKYTFGLGDPERPGHLYWCNPFDPDTASSANNLEVSPPTEPLVNGFIYNQRAYVFTKENIYAVYPSLTGGTVFISLQTSAGVGLWSDYCFAVGPKVWFLGKNGIYEFDGASAVNITETSLIRPIFYNQNVNTHPPVDMDVDPKYLRMTYEDPYLHFFYRATGDQFVAMRYHTILQRWEPKNVNFGARLPLVVGYWEEQTRKLIFGSDDGIVYEQGGFSDGGTGDTDGNPIEVNISTAFFDQDAPRNSKLYGDAFIEFDPKGAEITVTPYINEDPVNGLNPVKLPVTPGRQRAIIPVTTPLEKEGAVQARSIAFNFQWKSAEDPPILHEIDVSYLIRPEERTIRETDWDEAEYPAPKYVRGMIIDCDTFGNSKCLTIQGDGVTKVEKVVIPANADAVPNQAQRRSIQLSWPVFRAVQMRVITHDPDPWLVYKIVWLFDQEPEEIQKWDQNWQNLEWPYEKFIKGVSIEADTLGEDKTLELRIDGDDSTAAATITINHNGRSISMHKFDNILARTVKLVATDDNPGRLYRISYIWDREPPSLSRWETQESTFQSKGFLYLREAFIGIRSETDVCFNMFVDGDQKDEITIPTTFGDRRKIKVELPAVKGKNYKFLLTSRDPFKIYLGDCEVRLKEWNVDLGWKTYQLPFEGGEENP